MRTDTLCDPAHPHPTPVRAWSGHALRSCSGIPRDITMQTSRFALLACAALVAIGAITATRPAAASSLDFLNHMNPQYTNCIQNVHAQLQPQYKKDQKFHDAIIDACNRAHPAFGNG
jgi:hypothetical protein